MAAPMTGKEASDLNTHLKTPTSVEDDLIPLAHLAKSKTPPPFAPVTPSKVKSKLSRRKVAVTNGKKRDSDLKLVVHDSSSPHLSLKRKKTSAKRCKTPVKSSPIMLRAGEVQSSLGTECPSFIKPMVKSHVASCFWMGLPGPFCKSFLPKDDALIVIEDEKGEYYSQKYIAHRTGLSGGWKKFAIAHKLQEGDVLVFQLVESCKFKVYIVRENESKVNGALNLLNLEACTEHTTPDGGQSPKSKGKKHSTKKHKRSKSKSKSTPPSILVHPSNGISSEIPEIPESSKTPKPKPSFEKVKTFQDFHIMVNGECIDSELPDNIRLNYYKLCLAKKDFLHDDLREGLYRKLVAGMIGETVGIANEIENFKHTMAMDELEVLDNSLKSFEGLGMKVGFLRDRIRRLLDGSWEWKRYAEAKEERKRTDGEIQRVEAELVKLKKRKIKMDFVIDGLEEKVKRFEMKFEEHVNAPW